MPRFSEIAASHSFKLSSEAGFEDNLELIQKLMALCIAKFEELQESLREIERLFGLFHGFFATMGGKSCLKSSLMLSVRQEQRWQLLEQEELRVRESSSRYFGISSDLDLSC